MVLGASDWLLDNGEKIGVGSLYDEGVGRSLIGKVGKMGW